MAAVSPWLLVDVRLRGDHRDVSTRCDRSPLLCSPLFTVPWEFNVRSQTKEINVCNHHHAGSRCKRHIHTQGTVSVGRISSDLGQTAMVSKPPTTTSRTRCDAKKTYPNSFARRKPKQQNAKLPTVGARRSKARQKVLWVGRGKVVEQRGERFVF